MRGVGRRERPEVSRTLTVEVVRDGNRVDWAVEHSFHIVFLQVRVEGVQNRCTSLFPRISIADRVGQRLRPEHRIG